MTTNGFLAVVLDVAEADIHRPLGELESPVIKMVWDYGERIMALQYPPECVMTLEELIDGLSSAEDLTGLTFCPYCRFYEDKCLTLRQRIKHECLTEPRGPGIPRYSSRIEGG